MELETRPRDKENQAYSNEEKIAQLMKKINQLTKTRFQN